MTQAIPPTIPTVKIIDPADPADYSIINQDEFDPDTMALWTGGPIAPPPEAQEEVSEPVGEEGEAEPPPEPDAPEPPPVEDIEDRVKGALGKSVRDLGPWLLEQRNVEMLVYLLDRETRVSAKALIKAQLKRLGV